MAQQQKLVQLKTYAAKLKVSLPVPYLKTSFGNVEGDTSPWNVITDEELRNICLPASQDTASAHYSARHKCRNKEMVI
jgi:hypothetical protein